MSRSRDVSGDPSGDVSGSIARNSVFGLIGFLIPTAVLFLAYPVLLLHLGAGALGVYFLATSTSGALAFLDFGFSSAAVRFISEDFARGRLRDAADVLAASLAFYGALGLACAAAIWFAAPWLVNLFKAGTSGAVLSFRLAAIQFPAFLLITVFTSLFKALHRFHLAAAVVSLLSVLTWGGAVLAVLFAHAALAGICAIALGSNVAALAASIAIAAALCHGHRIPIRGARLRTAVFRRMFSFGSIMTVNQISSVCLFQVQKYLLGAWIGPAAVTIWQTAALAPSRVHAAVNAFTETVFPVSSAVRDRRRLRTIYLRMLASSAVLAIFAFGLFLTIQDRLMHMWIKGASAAQIIALEPPLILAYLFLALSPAPYHLVNGLGKPALNTVFFALNGALNAILIGIFSLRGFSLSGFGWAFAIANIVTAVAYQISVELLIWRKWLITSPMATAEAA